MYQVTDPEHHAAMREAASAPSSGVDAMLAAVARLQAWVSAHPDGPEAMVRHATTEIRLLRHRVKRSEAGSSRPSITLPDE